MLSKKNLFLIRLLLLATTLFAAHGTRAAFVIKRTTNAVTVHHHDVAVSQTNETKIHVHGLRQFMQQHRPAAWPVLRGRATPEPGSPVLSIVAACLSVLGIVLLITALTIALSGPFVAILAITGLAAGVAGFVTGIIANSRRRRLNGLSILAIAIGGPITLVALVYLLLALA